MWPVCRSVVVPFVVLPVCRSVVVPFVVLPVCRSVVVPFVVLPVCWSVVVPFVVIPVCWSVVVPVVIPSSHTLYDIPPIRSAFQVTQTDPISFPDDGRLLPKHVGASILNKGVV
jgi:hypothetical protein